MLNLYPTVVERLQCEAFQQRGRLLTEEELKEALRLQIMGLYRDKEIAHGESFARNDQG